MMFYNREKELSSDALVSCEYLWWQSFWGAYSNVAVKYEWRNSTFLSQEEGKATERWFYESVVDLREKIDDFLKNYAKLKE